jgi:hypothetical protein
VHCQCHLVSVVAELMGSNRLPFGLISGGYSCSEQYEWQQLTLRQKERTAWERPHRGANVNNPVHTVSRLLFGLAYEFKS